MIDTALVMTSAILGSFVIFLAAFNARINGGYRQLRQQNIADEMKISLLESQLETIRRKQRELQSELEGVHRDNKSMTGLLNDANRKNENLKERIKDLKAELRDLREPVIELESVVAKDVFKTSAEIQRTPVITQIDVVW